MPLVNRRFFAHQAYRYHSSATDWDATDPLNAPLQRHAPGAAKACSARPPSMANCTRARQSAACLQFLSCARACSCCRAAAAFPAARFHSSKEVEVGQVGNDTLLQVLKDGLASTLFLSRWTAEYVADYPSALGGMHGAQKAPEAADQVFGRQVLLTATYARHAVDEEHGGECSAYEERRG